MHPNSSPQSEAKMLTLIDSFKVPLTAIPLMLVWRQQKVALTVPIAMLITES